MNTTKQVNAMIGLLFLSVVIFGGYMLNESSRQDEADHEITERVAERGARLFVNNCRSCHGLEGKGPEEGAVAPAIHLDAYRIFEDGNEEGVEVTPAGEASQIRRFLFNTIACGRAGTFMPTWSQQYGGPLSDTQINQIVTMVTTGQWNLVEEIGAEHDAETGDTAETIIVTDPSSLSITANNCGQYSGELLQDIRSRDPFAAPGEGGGGPATPTPVATQAPADPNAPTVNVSLGEWHVDPAPPSIAAGGITFVATNDGAAAHELVVIRTDAPADALPLAAGSVDEGAVEVLGRTPNIQGGANSQLSLDLSAGSYVLLCNIPAHYGLGMHSAFTVE